MSQGWHDDKPGGGQKLRMRPLPQKAAQPDAHPGNDPPYRPPKLVNPEGGTLFSWRKRRRREGVLLLAKAQRREGDLFLAKAQRRRGGLLLAKAQRREGVALWNAGLKLYHWHEFITLRCSAEFWGNYNENISHRIIPLLKSDFSELEHLRVWFFFTQKSHYHQKIF